MALSGTNPNGFSSGQGTGLDVVVPADLKGAFIQRTGSGSGTVNTSGVRLVWDYGLDGLSDEDVISSIIVKVFALEMVYVAEGSFFAGDNAASQASFVEGSGDSDPWFIAGAGSIAVTASPSDSYYYRSSGGLNENNTGDVFSIPATFPNGFNDFYIMKYEVTEGQFISFFNTLTDAQKGVRDITSGSGKSTDAVFKRNTVAYAAGEATTLREDRAMNYLSWADGCALADWAGLRPMTELEFEKAARGTDIAAVSGEYAWGDTVITGATTISGAEDGSERITNSGARANFNNVTFSGGDGSSGPLRAGIFATSSATRKSSGAGNFGVMELSGNLVERTVSVGNASGRAFKGTHGDGELSFSGNATNPDWPGFTAGEVTGSSGSGLRGGSWSDASSLLQISDRQEASTDLSNRHSRFGFRAVRTAP
jgi:formylglycine-generating enzyme required for sulfatase activity